MALIWAQGAASDWPETAAPHLSIIFAVESAFHEQAAPRMKIVPTNSIALIFKRYCVVGGAWSKMHAYSVPNRWWK